MPVLSRDREEDVPECSGPGISQIFLGNIRFPRNGIRERRPLVTVDQIISHMKSPDILNDVNRITRSCSLHLLV